MPKIATKIAIEICCGSADDVIESCKAGADRVELNSSLFLGGLTPSAGELAVAKDAADIPVMAMVRPREGGFCYTEAEFRTALRDAEILLGHGADGIVFGFLNSDGTIDRDRCRETLRIIGKKESVFHRAIDVVPDWKEAIDTLCELGVTRVLTSGQCVSAVEGATTITEMIRYAAGRIQVLPGAGLRRNNICDFVAKTGCMQVHISPKRSYIDTSTSGNPEIHYGGALYPSEIEYRRIDGRQVEEMRRSIQET